MKREQKILVLDLINVGDQHRNNGEKDPYFSLVYLLGTEYSSLDAVISTQKKKKKFGSYNSLDNSRSALWESDENGLYFDGNIKDGGIG